MPEWELVDIALNIVQRTVEIGSGVIPLLIDAENQSAVVATLEVHGFAPGERSGYAQAACERAVQLYLQCVVAGRISLKILSAGGDTRILRLALRTQADDLPGVEVNSSRSPHAVIAHIGCIDNEPQRQNLLRSE